MEYQITDQFFLLKLEDFQVGYFLFLVSGLPLYFESEDLGDLRTFEDIFSHF